VVRKSLVVLVACAAAFGTGWNVWAQPSSRSGAPTAQPKPDLAVQVTASSKIVDVGEKIKLVASVTNKGDFLGSGVLNDFFPKNLTIVAVQAHKPVTNCIASEGHISCIVFAFYAGTTGTLTIVARPTKAGSLTNTARLDQVDKDTNRDNNKDSITITVNGPIPTPSPSGPFPSGGPQTGAGGAIPGRPLIPVILAVLALISLSTSWTLRRLSRHDR
jgi:hypothetical protein